MYELKVETRIFVFRQRIGEESCLERIILAVKSVSHKSHYVRFYENRKR